MESLDIKTTLTISTTVLLALVGFLIKYFNDLRMAERKDRLDLVNKQINELYGPLFALHYANQESWIQFRRRYRPGEGRSFWGSPPKVNDEEALAWRLWTTEIFEPLRSRMSDIILKNSGLIIENDFPQPLLELCAHVYSYKPVLKQWDSKDFTQSTSTINYPHESLSKYLEESHRTLRVQQAQLLRKISKHPSI